VASRSSVPTIAAPNRPNPCTRPTDVVQEEALRADLQEQTSDRARQEGCVAQENEFTSAGFLRAYVVPALLLFAIPAAGFFFARYADATWDAEFLKAAETSMSRDHSVDAAEKAETLAFFRSTPPSALCADGAARHPEMKPEFFAHVCGDYKQFGWIRMASVWSGVLGLVSLLVMAVCAVLAFSSRGLQYASFVAGWNFLRVTSAIEVIAQGFIAVMLSFWGTVVLTESYYVKLIAVVALLALVAAWRVIAAIFAKSDDTLSVDGEVLTRAASPALWSRVDGLCRKLGTRPATHIVGGIDDNFFVTEHPVQLNGHTLEGRTLFVSLSLLKRLDKGEADAVLAHEMAHFSGGDTEYSKKTSPMLARFRHYLHALYQGGLSYPIFAFMLLYWSLLQLALSKSSREREFRADRLAADATSPASMANALCKVGAYSSYRARVESSLFNRDKALGSVDIATSVATGFMDYARGPNLVSDLSARSFPHPFDSHPALGARMQAVGVTIGNAAVANAVTATAADTWFNEIGGAEEIEAKLWRAYEARFQAAHEESLAYRYLPSTPEERAHVERYFPTVELAPKDGGATWTMDCEQFHYVDWPAAFRWADIVDIKAKDREFRGKALLIQVRTAKGTEKLTVPLGKIAVNQDQAVAAIGAYYGRYKTAEANQPQRAAS
jgi:Zn-dependent protease with chaperone function